MPNRPEILMTPGPTPVPPAVLIAQSEPLVYHRGPGYGALLREVTEGLQKEIVADVVKRALDVRVHYPLLSPVGAGQQVDLCYGIMSVPPRSESVG